MMTIEREMLYQAFLAEKKFEKCSVKLRTRERRKSHVKCSSSIIPKQCVHVRLKCVV